MYDLLQNKQNADKMNLDSRFLSFNAAKWGVKILIIVLALIVFQLPLYLVGNLSSTRQQLAETVQNEIATKWGREQNIKLLPGTDVEKYDVEITPEIRYRGIYQAAVYTSVIKITAEYPKQETRTLHSANNNCIAVTAEYQKPGTMTGRIIVPDKTAVTSVSVTVNGKPVTVDYDLNFPLEKEACKCEITMTLRGSGKLTVCPNAQKSSVKFSGKWDSPSFIGDFLPEKREIKDGRFSSVWNLNQHNKDAVVGVNFCIAAGTYQQFERCLTYATFFLLVFFFTLVAAELITKVRICSLQYLIAAAAPVLFYLMTLAFSEKVGFTAGYIISATVIVAMVTMYARLFLGRMLPAAVMGIIFACSYLLNFIILRMEDYSLLTGTIVLAIILGVLMVLTGKINNKTPEQQ